MKPFSKTRRNKIIDNLDTDTHGTYYNDSKFLEYFLNINSFNLDLTEEIYRIFKWNFFIDDLKNKKLTFLTTQKFEDPYENLMLNIPAKYNDKIGNLYNLRDSYFISCWSLNPNCDGLWRTYHKKGQSVIKVRTNTRKLFSSIYDINRINHDTTFFIGKIRYVNDNVILKNIKRLYRLDSLDDGMIFIEQLFSKRKPFAYEKEVRVIVHDEKYSDKIREQSFEQNLLKLSFDPNSIFDEIIFDPWIKLSTFKNKVGEIRNAGYTGLITRSNLYDKVTGLVLKIK